MDDRALGIVIREVVRRNHVFNGIVYLQITRGAARRDHGFPVPAPPPTLLVSARELSYRALAKRVTEGVRVNTHLDFRWGRCDIKSIALLPNVLAKEAAREAGAFEAWFVDSTGIVTEGASSNAWIVDKAGVIRTRQLDHRILGGITRQAIVNLAIRQGWKLEERGFSVEEAKLATEAFLSSSTNPSIGVTSIDGVKIGDGRPGPVTKSIYEAYKSRTL
jgi:D-alanine transaminase